MLDEMLKACEPICRRIVWDEIDRRFLSREDGEDLMQAARLAVWEAARKWEARNQAQFTTFAWVVVRSRVKSAASRIRRHASLFEDEDGVVYEPGDDGKAAERLNVDAQRADLEEMLGLLSEEERRPLDLYAQGFVLSEIAARLGMVGKNPRGMALHQIKKSVDKIWERKLEKVG